MRMIVTALCLGALLCSCSSGPRGQYQLPVLVPVITSVVAPTADIVAGEQAQFTVNWDHGRAPCDVTWIFPEQPDPLTITTNTAGQTLATSVALTTVGSFTGTVEVKDAGGNAVSRSFSYTVVAAP
jgi:hypothetical protein